jgi:hypothetical protein
MQGNRHTKHTSHTHWHTHEGCSHKVSPHRKPKNMMRCTAWINLKLFWTCSGLFWPNLVPIGQFSHLTFDLRWPRSILDVFRFILTKFGTNRAIFTFDLWWPLTSDDLEIFWTCSGLFWPHLGPIRQFLDDDLHNLINSRQLEVYALYQASSLSTLLVSRYRVNKVFSHVTSDDLWPWMVTSKT